MRTKTGNIQPSDLAVLLSIQLMAFALFHLVLSLYFQIEFVRVILLHPWVNVVAMFFGRVVFLYGPAIYFAWQAIRSEQNRFLLLAFSTVTFCSAYFLHYPVITGILCILGLFDPFPVFWFNNIPSIAEYPPL